MHGVDGNGDGDGDEVQATVDYQIIFFINIKMGFGGLMCLEKNGP